jgi:hypothetical protein
VRAVHRLLTVVGALLLLTGTVAGVVNREVLDAQRFSAHVDAVRSDPDVARRLGAVVTARILEAQPDLTALRPLIESTATSVVASPVLGSTVRAAALGPVYRVVTEGGHDTVVLRLADVAAIVLGVVSAAAPEHRAALPAELDVRLSRFGGQDVPGDPLSWVHLVRLLAWLLPLLGLLVLAGSGALLGADGRSARARLTGAVATLGRGALGAGVALAVLLAVTGLVVRRSDRSTLEGALRHAVWGQLDGSFWAAAGVVAASGYLLVLLSRPGTGLRAELTPADRLSRVWQLTLDPGPGLEARLVRAGFVLLAGVALALQPLQVARALIWATGLVLLVVGVALLVQVVVTALRSGAIRRGAAAAVPERVRWAPVAAGLALVVLVAVFLAGARPADDDLASAIGHDPTPCNGYAVLCDRPYDEVAFPATHNAMSAADEPGWFFAEQPDGVVSQLDHGIRALLVDSWYGQRTQRRGIIANTDESRAAARAEAVSTLGTAAVDSALRLRNALDLTPRGPAEPYLCHALCELGSTKWLPVMKDVRTWLAAHPRDVVTFFVQDTVSPADTAEVFRRAGLLPYVYTPALDEAPDRPWPTLGQMIDSGQRLVVLMENHGGGTTYPWLLQGFDWAQDTPFLFRSPSAFSCEPNRGPADARVFLVNHWITDKTREISNAEKVNRRDVLLPRLRSCESERGLFPTFVAVDFYDRGDLFGVVDTLNGTG